MQHSPEVQARLDAKAAQQRVGGPSFPMPRLRHNGETGEWMVREVDGERNADEATKFETDKDGSWSGIVVAVAFMAQTKYKKDAVAQKMTREFTNFKNEPIELLKRTFGPEGKTEFLRTFPTYQDFKAASVLKDEEGNPSGSAYDLKVCLYVYHLERKQVVKLVVGGSGRTEWFAYDKMRRGASEEGTISTPWRMGVPGARLLEEVVTRFTTSKEKTDKGLEYHRLSFDATGYCPADRMAEVLDVADKIAAWSAEWKAINAKQKIDPREVVPEAIKNIDPGAKVVDEETDDLPWKD